MASRGGPRGGARSGAHAGGRSNVGAAVKCYFCGRAGHVKKDCFKLKNSQTGGAGPAQHAKN
jgi:hypothetical protein